MSNPWIIDEADFYELETHEEQMAFLLRYAILAPSGHNTQPWSFRITPHGVEVFADFTRRLLIADSGDRELLMSVGAAMANFRVAAAHFLFESTVAYEQRTVETLPVATILVRETCAPDHALAALFPAICKRHTNRGPYDEQPLGEAALQAVCDFVDTAPGTLRLILPRDTESVVATLQSAERTLLSRPAYRAELAEWVRHDGRRDGLSPEAIGVPRVLSGIAPWMIRTFDTGAMQAHRDAELARASSLLLVVTSEDDRASLLQAGETLERLLLTITACGLQYSFLNAAVEVEESRKSLQLLTGAHRPPQVLLRVGMSAVAAQPTPRRPVQGVMV